MSWNNCKERMPKRGEVVLVKLKRENQYYVARFFDDHIICSGGEEYKNTWFLILPPKFPQKWMGTQEHKKAFRIRKERVTHWMEIPEIGTNTKNEND